jgi:hypothetical protein
MGMNCRCIKCDFCHGTGHMWIGLNGKISQYRPDLGTLEPCDECVGGIVQICDECMDFQEAEFGVWP